MDGDWEKLGRAVLNRRVELGHATIASFAPVVGLSTRILGDIESGRRTSYDPATLVRLERALQWEPGRVWELLGVVKGRSQGGLTSGNVIVPSGTGPAELLTPEGLARYLYRDDLVLVALLERSGLDEGALFRLVLRIRARREQQNAELLNEVAGLIRDAGGAAPDPAYPPTWLVDGLESG